ncbi:PHD finger protein 23A-like [Onthophagus taurus]|uniref:PHD finger protein 23A-like n=1 Tax=Onthophagus taurus TaxID=166361 RepID=UPI000C200251|nr:PHD finger protein 23A-like [Onthophagus taurus]
MAEENTNDETSVTTNGTRRPRTSEDFYMFCTYVLQYENYDTDKKEEVRNAVNQSPPLDSSGSSVNSESTNSDAQQDDKPSGDDTDDGDSYDLITCFCGKPFAGRPMIECSNCLTWIHLTCAKIKKSNIPDVFHCARCKPNKKQRSASPTNPPDKTVKRPKRTT